MDWSREQIKTIEKYCGLDWKNKPPGVNSKWKKLVPSSLVKFKCHQCKTIIPIEKVDEDGSCPKCGDAFLVQMCPLDHCYCTCNGGKPIESIEYCPICGDPICPSCATHDVTQISRVTGYLQEVSGFNEAKKQELKDRRRVEPQELQGK